MRKHNTAKKRGAVTLFFLMFALPIIWVAGSIGVDYTRISMVRSEVTAITRAAASAAAPFAIANQSGQEDSSDVETRREQAEAAAKSVINTACLAGARVKSDTQSESCEQVADSIEVSFSADRAEVTVRYRIDGLIFLGILERYIGEYENDNYTDTVTVVSSACVAGSSDACIRQAR